ncbi:hypothetical protein GGD81_000138 [Rhodobium orientis]|uniref:hypothetical protein n=1 Tax=Rhodobium orientis TaxID=34017 RepID=UPI0011B936E0|nr:hypothetical protein [Rhodobium orientis]MBB4301123.1 hypothetical protein [Rhodobium orientis]
MPQRLARRSDQGFSLAILSQHCGAPCTAPGKEINRIPVHPLSRDYSPIDGKAFSRFAARFFIIVLHGLNINHAKSA